MSASSQVCFARRRRVSARVIMTRLAPGRWRSALQITVRREYAPLARSRRLEAAARAYRAIDFEGFEVGGPALRVGLLSRRAEGFGSFA
jgi:hypothetical protein